MTVLTVIMGILLIACGVLFMLTPVASFLSLGYFVAFLLLFCGVAGLIRAIQGRSYPLEIVVNILSIIVGGACIWRPGTKEAFDGIVLLIIAAWFIIQGIFTIRLNLRIRDVSMTWFFGFLVGILSVVVGVLSIIYPTVAMVAVEYMIAFYFIESGLSMIFTAAAVSTLKDMIKKEIKDIEERQNAYDATDDMQD
jgi:uncharacterized membrane protein HdeD (DUF308 family)